MTCKPVAVFLKENGIEPNEINKKRWKNGWTLSEIRQGDEFVARNHREYVEALYGKGFFERKKREKDLKNEEQFQKIRKNQRKKRKKYVLNNSQNLKRVYYKNIFFLYMKIGNYIAYLQTKQSSELSNQDINFLRKNGIINGCGGNPRSQQTIIGKIFFWISCILAKHLAPIFFEASCNLHDFGYWKGGDEERRKECDKKFYGAIRKDIWKQPFYLVPYYEIVAFLFYIAVRIGGKSFFCYKPKENGQDTSKKRIGGWGRLKNNK